MGENSSDRISLESGFEDDEPLGLAFARYNKHERDDSLSADEIRDTKLNWIAFLTEWKSPGSEFAARLSKPQRNVARILIEWWGQETDQTAYATAIMSRIKSCMESKDWSNFTSRKDHMITDKDYHSQLQSLFMLEFLKIDNSFTAAMRATYEQQDQTSDEHVVKLSAAVNRRIENAGAPLKTESVNLTTDSRLRNRAAVAAARQRLTFSTLSSLNCAGSELHPPSSAQVSPSVCNVAQLPKDGKGGFNRFPDAFYKPCPWLPQKTGADLPRFLWSVEDKRTVDYEHETQRPPYTIISHTWGRWMVPSSDPNPDVHINGVDWKVPRNTRFDVEAMPEVFWNHRDLFAPTKHIWFDLFCIPQDESIASWALAKEQEIGRQAAIFDSAYQAICWLNDIDDWNPTQAIIQWMSLMFAAVMEHGIEKTDIYHEDPSRLQAIQKGMSEKRLHDNLCGGDFNTGFLKAIECPADRRVVLRGQDFVSGKYEISFVEVACGWFTSLWTLQEITLRPDMVLCNRAWAPLRLDAATDSPYVPMDHIIALFELHAIPGMSALERQFPTAVRELIHTFQISGLLYSSAGLHPLGLLSTADARTCRMRRAEAIMSAIGATQWYHHVPRAHHEQHLVLGVYPVQFLREVRRLFGDAFFASQFAVCCEFWDVYEDVDERLRRPREDQAGPVAMASTNPRGAFVVGTMLPFNSLRCSSRRWCLNWPHSPESDRSLPSNRTWELGDDGRVIMAEVSLIASSDRGFYPPESETDHHMWRIYGPDIENPRQIAEHARMNIHEYLRSQLVQSLPGRAKHAILTMSTLAKVTGVVLMQIYDDEEPVKTFAKVADFELDVTRQAGSVSKMVHKHVAWEVL